MDIDNFESISTEIIGKKSWGVKKGHGSFLTIEFGGPIDSEKGQVPHGEWHLWAYSCSWRIEKNGQLLVGSADSNEKMTKLVKSIEGTRLDSFKILSQTLDAVLCFDNGNILRLFSIVSDDKESEEYPHWLLYLPNNRILVAGPGNNFVVEIE